MAMFDRPIPGQSLTETPKNKPYERPPELVDPERALQVHLLRLSDPDRMEAAIALLEEGIDLVTLTEGIVRNAVMNGIHSLDVGILIAPVIHEYIKSTADELGVEYEEGFDNDEERKRLSYSRQETKAKKMLKNLGVETPNIQTQSAEQETPEEVTEARPSGLMARG